ncbi:hypothetical protein X943_001288 [Babesia divergens]|uniref:mRNA export factor GLE1 n=1 Tax=Babesia divergens TaxID=32595 RepID=A0AAD9GJG4_BABDI|nr:hypothetical protein X943_001288 [Babesia divergens]
MSKRTNDRRRGVALALSERVFQGNRSIAVPVTNVQATNVTLDLPKNSGIVLELDNDKVNDNWEPTWVEFDRVESLIEGEMQKSKQPYMNLITDALAEISKLEEQRAAKIIQKQNKALLENQKIKTTSVEAKAQPEKPQESKTAIQPPQLIAEPSSQDELMTQQEKPPAAYLPCNAHTRQIDEYEVEFERLKAEYEAFVASGDPAVKQARLDIAKRIITTVNTLAATQKQIDNSYSTLVNIRNQYGSEPKVLVFMTFRVIENVLDCCEPGCQMYLNPKSVWPFAHLIRGLMAVGHNCREVYYSMIKKRCPYIIPRLYQSNDEEKLKQLHQYSKHNSNTYFRKQVTLVRLHLAIMAVTQDVEGLWAWFAGFLNACPAKVFKPPLPGVLITALTVAAHMCLETYKGQFKKVLLCCEDLFNKGVFRVKNCESADMYNEQLSQFFREFRKMGTIKEPEGYKLKEQEEELRKDF